MIPIGEQLSARRFAAVAFASELADDPALLHAYRRTFGDASDTTLVIYAVGASVRELQQLEQLLAGDAPPEGGADILAVTAAGDPSVEAALAERCHAAYTRRTPPAALRMLPRAADAWELRTIADGLLGAPA